ncbi:hypothetical protein [Glycomyces terrestris]|uniref:Uncharacterized protein n=1 Tax=Glycomyces terrestris TaxID=2493553 RepID=A0A426V4R5_9ACTN|nr:hypothetical protein [Glycomyces terrestris]RRS01866.1 hypothetical protein EIW28_03735 [Glycomyces terrestris]
MSGDERPGGRAVERVTDRPQWRDAARTAAGAAVAAGAVAAAAAGTPNGWPLALLAAAGAAAWPLSRWRNLARRQVVAEFDREGVRLYPETARRGRGLGPAVDLPWAEVRGIYFWRKRTGLVWTTMLGVEPVRSDPRGAPEDREGVPAHVSSALARRSVPFSASGRARVEAAARRFTMRARVVDARRAPRARRTVY